MKSIRRLRSLATTIRLTRASSTPRIAVLLLGLIALNPARAATITWNNTGTNPSTNGDWVGGTAPASTDVAQFTPVFGSSSTGTTSNPVVSSGQSALSVIIGNDPGLGGYTFTGTNTLTLGGTGTVGLSVRGFGTTTLNGPAIAGAGASSPNTALINVYTDSGLTLAGASVANTNVGNISLLGGTLTLDNTGTNTAARLPTTNSLILNGGSLSLLGNFAGTTVNAGTLNTTAGTATPGEGYVTIGVTVPSGATSGSTLNFANSAAFSLRTTTGLAYDFVGVGGVLGSAGGPRITFTTAPTITTTTGAGMIDGSTTVTSSTVGFAIATDSSGTGWATYVAPAGSGATATGGIEILAPTATAVTNTDLQGLTSASVADFTPAASSTTTLASNSTTGSLRIVPGGSGASLAIGGATAVLKTNGILLTGTNDFAITGSGNLDGTATKNIFVANPSTTLSPLASTWPAPAPTAIR